MYRTHNLKGDISPMFKYEQSREQHLVRHDSTISKRLIHQPFAHEARQVSESGQNLPSGETIDNPSA